MLTLLVTVAGKDILCAYRQWDVQWRLKRRLQWCLVQTGMDISTSSTATVYPNSRVSTWFIALILQNVSHIWASERQSGVSYIFYLEKSHRFACRRYYHWPHKRNLSNKIGSGGGGSRLWVLGTLIYEQVNLQRGGRWLEPDLNIHTPISPTLTPPFFFYFYPVNSISG